MRVLLDTHTWLWFVLGVPDLSSAARAVIEDPAIETFLSPASYWEISIKISLGKYALNQPFDAFIQHAIGDQGFQILPILPAHMAALITLPFHHRDPFDRLLIAQAQTEGFSVVSTDAAFDAYSVKRLW